MPSVQCENRTITIADNAQASSAFSTKGYARGSIGIPTGFVGTALTFSVSLDDSTYFGVEAAGGSAVSLTVEATKVYALPVEIMGWPYVKVTSGSSETGGPLTLPVVLLG